MQIWGFVCRYGDGTIRLTVEQDVLFPFIPNDKVEEMSKEPIFQKYLIDAGNLTRGLVSCTGAQVRFSQRAPPAEQQKLLLFQSTSPAHAALRRPVNRAEPDACCYYFF